jgi:hypothetical protein
MYMSVGVMKLERLQTKTKVTRLTYNMFVEEMGHFFHVVREEMYLYIFIKNSR